MHEYHQAPSIQDHRRRKDGMEGCAGAAVRGRVEPKKALCMKGDCSKRYIAVTCTGVVVFADVVEEAGAVGG